MAAASRDFPDERFFASRVTLRCELTQEVRNSVGALHGNLSPRVYGSGAEAELQCRSVARFDRMSTGPWNAH